MFASNSAIKSQRYPVDGFEGRMSSNDSPAVTRMSCVGSDGSGNGLGVSPVGMNGGVGVGVKDSAAQPVSRMVPISKRHILFIVISMSKYT